MARTIRLTRTGGAVILTAAVMTAATLSGCRDLLIDLSQASWKTCERDYDESDSVDTDFGEIRVMEVEGTCPDAGTWQIWGPGERKVEDLRTEPEDIDASSRAPWMRVTAKLDGEQRAWDFAVTKDSNNEVRAEQCDTLALNTTPPDLAACLGDEGDLEWASAAKRLGDGMVFDDAALAYVRANLDDPARVAEALSYFKGTWQPRKKSSEGQKSRRVVRELVDDMGCMPFARYELDSAWARYVEAVDVLLGSRSDEFLESCDRWLLERWPAEATKIRARLDDPAIVAAVDAAFLEHPELPDPSLVRTWITRLEHAPPPSTDLLNLMDRSLFDVAGEYSDTYVDIHPIEDRLDIDLAIEPANAALLAEQVVEHYLDHPLFEPVFERPELAPYHSVIDDGLVDRLVSELSKAEPSYRVMRNLTYRIHESETHRFDPDVRRRLESVLARNLPETSKEALRLLERTSDPAALASFLSKFDAGFVDAYPAASEAFLERLEPGFWPRPDEATREAIIDKARAMKDRGETFDTAACKVLRAALLQETSACTVPADF